MTPGQIEFLRKKYDFRWDVLDIIIRGKSSIDSQQGFSIRSVDEADRFIRSYGYDLENPIEQAEAFGNFHEALNFIRRYFLQPENPSGLKIEVPRRILEITDIRDLFLMANLAFPSQNNDRSGLLLRNWACSILKVMHTIAHVDQDLRTSHFPDIQKQIFDRYYKVIQRNVGGKLYLGEKLDDPTGIELIAFETKPKKSRDSTLVKLLHKPENVAEDIFDRVGIRIITPTRLDALRVIRFLKEQMLVMPPNIKPSRSRNTLVDLDYFRSKLEEGFTRVEKGELNEEQLVGVMEEATHVKTQGGDNPHTSEFYHSIQFTCRQLIKLKNPLYTELKELKALAKGKALTPEIDKVIERIDLKYIAKESRFFYPYEVQVVDQKSHEENEKGRSAHSEYKKAQLQTAMKRVMGVLADVVR